MNSPAEIPVIARQSERLGELIEERIVTGAYPPGTRLDEQELATTFGLTKVRTPRHLLTAPFALHRRLVAHIAKVAAAARAGQPARIAAPADWRPGGSLPASSRPYKKHTGPGKRPATPIRRMCTIN